MQLIDSVDIGFFDGRYLKLDCSNTLLNGADRTIKITDEVGAGRDLILQPSCDGTTNFPGDLYLRPGTGMAFVTTYGVVYIADQGGTISTGATKFTNTGNFVFDAASTSSFTAVNNGAPSTETVLFTFANSATGLDPLLEITGISSKGSKCTKVYLGGSGTIGQAIYFRPYGTAGNLPSIYTSSGSLNIDCGDGAGARFFGRAYNHFWSIFDSSTDYDRGVIFEITGTWTQGFIAEFARNEDVYCEIGFDGHTALGNILGDRGSQHLPATTLDLFDRTTVSANTADAYAAALTLDPDYSAADTAATYVITRHNYICLSNVSTSSAYATVLTSCVFYFDASAGTHLALDSGTTKAGVNTVNAWFVVNMEGVVGYMPIYTSKTA